MHFGTPEFSIHCERHADLKGIGYFRFEMAGEALGDFTQPCMLSIIGFDLEALIVNRNARINRELADMPPADALNRVYDEVFGPAATPETAFWLQQYVFLNGPEPFDGIRSIALRTPPGFVLIASSGDGRVIHRQIERRLFENTVLDFMAWLQLNGLAVFEAISRTHDLAFGYDKALKRIAAAMNRERKRVRR